MSSRNSYSLDTVGAMYLCDAAVNGDTELLRYLLDKGLDVNAQDPKGNTALMRALEMKNRLVVEMLFDAGADPTVLNSENNKSALRVVCAEDDLSSELHSMFLQKFCQKCSSSEDAAKKFIDAGAHLYQAVYAKDAKVLGHMLERGVSVDSTIPESRTTALHAAVSLRDVASAKVLLDHGADVNSSDFMGCNPLYFVYDREDKEHSAEKVEMLRLLLSRGASPTACTFFGEFQATSTLMNGDSRALRVLLSYWDFTAEDGYWNAGVLHYLAVNLNPGVVDELKNHIHKWHVNAGLGNAGLSPLQLAANAANPRMLEFLLDSGSDVDKAIAASDKSALFLGYAMARPGLEEQYDECAEILLQRGADPQWSRGRGDRRVTIFDVALNNRRNGYDRLEPLIAQLAIVEGLGTPIREVIRAKISSRPEWELYYDRCRGVLRTNIHGTVTLLKYLTANERNLAKYANNEDMLRGLGHFCDEHEVRSSFPYYHKTLTKRFSWGIELRRLRDAAAGRICRIFGGRVGETHVVVGRLSDYLRNRDLWQLCQL